MARGSEDVAACDGRAMNWLDPDEVREWLATTAMDATGTAPWKPTVKGAIQEFVRAMAGEDPLKETDLGGDMACTKPDAWVTVARLLRDALEGRDA